MLNILKNKTLWFIIGVFIATRILVIGIGIVSYNAFPQQITPTTFQAKGINDSLSYEQVWSRWDTAWYQQLAKEGYPQREFSADTQQTWGFLPLYPILIKLFSYVFFGNYFWAGVFVSTVCSLAAMFVLYKLFEEKLGKGKDVVVLILLTAGSFYFNIVYADGLYLLLASLVFYFSYKKKYALALIFAGLGTITRIHGFLLFLIPVVEILLYNRKQIIKYIPFFILGLLPIIGLMIYLHITCGEPLAFIRIQKGWGSPDLYPFQGVINIFIHSANFSSMIHLGFWILYITMYSLTIKKIPIQYTVFFFAVFLLSVSNENIYGSVRYILPVIPLCFSYFYSKPLIQKVFLISNISLMPLAIATFITSNALFL